MENNLINYFLKNTNLSADEVEVIAESMVIKSLKKNDYLVKERQFNNDTYFLLRGCVRQFKIVDGNDITTNFYTEDQWIVSLGNFSEKTASNYNLVCMENTTVVIGNDQQANELVKQFPAIESISRQIMETVLMAQQNLMFSYITDKPEQRYLKLLKARPDIFQRVPQYDIATYLGIKPESLSRIRKKLQRQS